MLLIATVRSLESGCVKLLITVSYCPMAQLKNIVTFLDNLLEINRYGDTAFNGLQIESGNSVSKIGAAVDSGNSILQKAVEENCDLLIVHHGLMWDNFGPLTGILGNKVRLMMTKGCSLYAAHLPLDGNRDVGNCFEIARALNLENLNEFCPYMGAPVGCSGKFLKPISLNDLAAKVSKVCNNPNPLVIPYGPSSSMISSVGIVTGSGAFAIRECAKLGIDVLISGEPKHQVFHEAKELGVNAIFAGHYLTEVFGVKALLSRLEKDFGVSTVFIDEPSGI